MTQPPPDETPPPDRAQDTSIPELMRLPPRTRKEEIAGHLRNLGLLAWGAYLALMFAMSTLHWWEAAVSAMDLLLWPILTTCGRLGGVILIAALSAALSMVAQYLLGDTPTIREVKRRTELLRTEAARYPLKSPRDTALSQEANKGALRLAGYSFVALGALLGPMMLSFLWIGPRVEFQNPLVAEGFALIATVEGGYTGDVQLQLPAALSITEKADSQAEGLAPPEGTRVIKWAVVSQAAGLQQVTVATTSDKAALNLRIGQHLPPSLNIVKSGNVELETIAGQGVIKTLSSARIQASPPLLTLGSWQVGWLWIYMVVYIPVMLLTKRLLKIP